MTHTPVSEQELIEAFLPVILDNEAKGVLQDLLGHPSLALHFITFDETDTRKAIRHVQGILEECYRAGHLKVAMSHENGRLYGYALLFEHPDPTIPRYCHKIFVFKQYRGHGIGTQLLQALTLDTRGSCLLCSNELIPFYESVGLEVKGTYTAPGAQQGFAFTRDLYTGLTIMGSPSAGSFAPVFMLNDQDIKQLMVLGAG
ncbi:GNAT family N-acetyltransferase [Pseudomonas paralactis]|uniref:GNAT family N-acetyltransferase n=1 Tax=Pseudomonas paralactis TaxID=1615673 RepID=UPI0034D7AD6B